MSIIKVEEIQNEAGTSSFQVKDIPNAGAWSFRNKIINGDFIVWQRGTTFTGATGMSADRWRKSGTNNSATLVIDSTYNKVLRLFKSTSVSQWQNISTKIELPSTEAGKTYTLSFKIKWATYSADTYLWMKWVDGTILSGDASFGTNHMGANIAGWQTISHTFIIPDDATDYSYFDMRWHGNSSTGTVDYDFQIAEVQLEEGNKATPFEHRPYQVELTLCQRFYATIARVWGARYGSTQAFCEHPWPVPMRATPTIAYTNNGSGYTFSSNYTTADTYSTYYAVGSTGYVSNVSVSGSAEF